jgi:hypothetical protein
MDSRTTSSILYNVRSLNPCYLHIGTRGNTRNLAYQLPEGFFLFTNSQLGDSLYLVITETGI